jgi:hypothetical protein
MHYIVTKSSLTSSHALPSLDPDHRLAYWSLIRSVADLLDFKNNSEKQLGITESVAASLQDLDFWMMRCLSRDDSFLVTLRVDLVRRNVSQK